MRHQETPIRRPLFDPVPFVIAVDWRCLLSPDFNFLHDERRIASAVRKKIERNVARIWRPDRIRLRVRISRERSRRIARQIDQPQTPSNVLVDTYPAKRDVGRPRQVTP